MSVTPELETRDYKISDPYMLEFAKDIHSYATEDILDLAGFDPDFTAAFLAAYNTAISDAEAVPSDEQVENIITQMTNDLETQMGVCRKKFQDTKYFIERAFPKDKATWNEFGYERYDKARNVQPRLIEFMRDFHATAVKYTAELGAVNYNLTLIDDIKTQGDLLDQRNREQNAYINNRSQITKERVVKHNAVWAIATRLCTAGKSVFYNNYSKYKRYLLPASDETESFILSGKVTQPVIGPIGTPPAAVEDVTVTVMGVPDATTQTDSNGNYGFTNLPAGTYSVEFSKTGYMPNMQPGVVITDMENPVTLNVTLTPMP
ncbi:MAG: carboxypeptidase-like regulatory domain-containing protein [Bacteroidia bacterium]